MNRILANGLLVFSAILIMVGVFEVLCRTVINDGMQYHIEMWRYAVELKRIAKDSAIGHEHSPGARARLMGVDVSINSGGLRNNEIEPVKQSETTRVLMLGDSVTFGWGVPFDGTASKILERELIAYGTGLFEVINAGVGNYNTAMETSYFFDDGKAYTPDIVVLNYFINDAEQTPTYEEVPWLANHSYAYAVIGGAWDGLKRHVPGGVDWRTYYASLYEDSAPGWRLARESIARLAGYCDVNEIRLIIVNIPELRELNDYPFADVTNKLEAFAASQQAEFVDLLPALRGQPASTLWVTEPDPHPNARAHEIMGRYLAGYLMGAAKR